MLWISALSYHHPKTRHSSAPTPPNVRHIECANAFMVYSSYCIMKQAEFNYQPPQAESFGVGKGEHQMVKKLVPKEGSPAAYAEDFEVLAEKMRAGNVRSYAVVWTEESEPLSEHIFWGCKSLLELLGLIQVLRFRIEQENADVIGERTD